MKTNMWLSLAAALGVAALGACGSQSGKAAEAPQAPKSPASRTLAAGRQLDMVTTATISSHTAKTGDSFTATVAADVQDGGGRVAIPSGSVVHGTIIEVKSGPNPDRPGTLTLGVTSVTVRGRDYPIAAVIESLNTEQHGGAISGGDVARVGAGAAAGAIVGQIIGKNTKGTVIGAVIGGAAGAAYAAATKDRDVVLPAGTHVLVTLTRRLDVSAS